MKSADRLQLLIESARDYAMFTMDAEGNIDSWNIGAERILGWSEEEVLGQPAALIFVPEDRVAGVPEQEFATARETGRAEDERWHLRKDGSRFYASGVMTRLQDDKGAFLGFGKVLRDLTERKRHEDILEQANQDLEKGAQQRTQDKQLWRGMGARVEEERRRISRELHDQTGQNLATIGMKLSALETAATATREAALLAASAATMAARASREASHASEVAAEAAAKLGAAPEAIRLAREAAERARNAAITSSDARSACEAANSALDVVEENAPHLTELRELVSSLNRDIHRIAVDLRPTSLDDLGLVAALDGHIKTWEVQTGIVAGLVSVGLEEKGKPSQRLPSEVETALYRIVQEALTNIAKHAARATQVAVTLQRVDSHVLVIVEDNGPGFDPEAARADRLGLSGMRERAKLLGGTLSIESAPGSGSTIFARLPVP